MKNLSQIFRKELIIMMTHPLHYQERYKEIRIAFLEGFPYGIHFLLEKDEIKIIKILHHKREF